MYRQVFGDENAETDELLYECYIAPPGAVVGKPILVGKWRAGKTGLILQRNKPLSDKIALTDGASDRSWYLDETGRHDQSLVRLNEHCQGDVHLLKRLLESVWRAEICRALVRTLILLQKTHDGLVGPHWQALSRFGTTRNVAEPLWKMIPLAAGVLLGEERSRPVKDLLRQVDEYGDEKTFAIVQKCIKDTEREGINVVVAIERIETPDFELESTPDLAQILVTCLLNVFIKDFQPSAKQRIAIQLSIPWHRYVRDEVGEPQKLFPFVGRFHWTKSSLREFINQRIEWEFRRVRRSFQRKGPVDAWSALFGEAVINRSCGNIREESFDYILRHSQYRPRDILRMAREIVEHEVASRTSSEDSKSNIAIDEVLLGRGGRKISEKNIRAAVRRTAHQTAVDRIIEAERRFPIVRELSECIRGMAIPFSAADLKRRIESHFGPRAERIDLSEAVEKLWHSGIIGVEITTHTPSAAQHISSVYSSGVRSPTSGGRTERFYLFEYNADRDITQIVRGFPEEGLNEQGDAEYALVLHPVMFEYLSARRVNEYVIGV